MPVAERSPSSWGAALVTALMLLTRLPIPARWQPLAAPSAELLNRSALCYPLVGLLLGVLLWLAASVLVSQLPPLACAALVLALWVYLTGALHLDGLADGVDGLAAGHRDPERLRAAMKDSHVGAMGAVAIALGLIVKFALISAVLEQDAALMLVLIPALGRWIALVCIQITPYQPVAGPAAQRGGSNPARAVMAWGVALLIGTAAVAGISAALLLLVGGGGWFWYWRSLWLRALGGYSGDTLGGLIETSEIVLLVMLCMAW